MKRLIWLSGLVGLSAVSVIALTLLSGPPAVAAPPVGMPTQVAGPPVSPASKRPSTSSALPQHGPTPTPRPRVAVPTPAAVGRPNIDRSALLNQFHLGRAIHRIDRKEAKLLMLGELEDAFVAMGFGRDRNLRTDIDDSTIVWAGALSGDVEPFFARHPVPWEITYFHGTTGEWLGDLAAVDHGTWPSAWDRLPDRDPALR